MFCYVRTQIYLPSLTHTDSRMIIAFLLHTALRYCDTSKYVLIYMIYRFIHHRAGQVIKCILSESRVSTFVNWYKCSHIQDISTYIKAKRMYNSICIP